MLEQLKEQLQEMTKSHASSSSQIKQLEAECRKLKASPSPDFVRNVFESNLTTLDLTAHKNLHIFKTDFDPIKMTKLDDLQLLKKLNNINAVIRDHFMELIDEIDQQVSAAKPSNLDNHFSKQLKMTEGINLNEYFLVKPQGDIVEDMLSIFIFNEKHSKRIFILFV